MKTTKHDRREEDIEQIESEQVKKERTSKRKCESRLMKNQEWKSVGNEILNATFLFCFRFCSCSFAFLFSSCSVILFFRSILFFFLCFLCALPLPRNIFIVQLTYRKLNDDKVEIMKSNFFFLQFFSLSFFFVAFASYRFYSHWWIRWIGQKGENRTSRKR